MADDTVLDFPAKSSHGDGAGNGIATLPVADATAEPVAVDPAIEEAMAFESLSFYPQPADDPYIAHSRPLERSLPMLLILQNDGTETAFAYHDLRHITHIPPLRPGLGRGLLLRFIGLAEVQVWASHSAFLYGRLYTRRLGWIRELPEGWGIKDDSAVVITSIKIKVLTPIP